MILNDDARYIATIVEKKVEYIEVLIIFFMQ